MDPLSDPRSDPRSNISNVVVIRIRIIVSKISSKTGSFVEDTSESGGLAVSGYPNARR